MVKNSLLVLLLAVSVLQLHAQNRYMVFFTDKSGSTYSISNPSEYLSERAIQRREKYGIAITEQDLPVPDTYVNFVRSSGANVLYRTRWMNGVLVECDESLVPVLQAISGVTAVELVAPGVRPSSNGRRRSGQRISAGEVTDPQNSQVGIPQMHAAGYHGEGIYIAVLDAGFEGVSTAAPFAPLFDENRIQLTYDFAYGQVDVYQHDRHGTEVLSVIGGYQPGTYTGGAYKATFQLYVTEYVPDEQRVEEYNWLFAAERADSAGVDIINTSLGYNTFNNPTPDYTQADMDGETAVITKAAQWAIERGVVVVASAGNEGNNSWKIITAPADGKDVIAVGSVNSAGDRSGSSSIGPTADGRIKPNVMATGVGTAVIKPAGNTGTASGTSFAAPVITGLVAGILQRYPDKSPSEILTLLQESASQALQPDNFMGYGIPNFVAVVNLADWETQEDLLLVYPNPVVDTLMIKPRSPLEVPEVTVEIASIEGKQLANKAVSFNWLNRTYITDLSELAAGVYVLRIWIEGRVYAYKLVKI